MLSRHQVGTMLELVPDQVDVLKKCTAPLSTAELMKSTGRTSRTKFKKNIIGPLILDGLIEMTGPKSPKQKYRLTEKGKQLI